jgi:hypothetical protein
MTLLLIALIIFWIVCSKSKANKEAEHKEYLKKTRTNVSLEKEIRKKWLDTITKEFDIQVSDVNAWEFAKRIYDKYNVPWYDYLTDEYTRVKDYNVAKTEIETVDTCVKLEIDGKKEKLLTTINTRKWIFSEWQDVTKDREITRAEFLKKINNSDFFLWFREGGYYQCSYILYPEEGDFCLVDGYSIVGVDVLSKGETKNKLTSPGDWQYMSKHFTYMAYVVLCKEIKSKFNNLVTLLTKLELKQLGYTTSRDGIHDSYWQEFDKQQARKAEQDAKYPHFKDL